MEPVKKKTCSAPGCNNDFYARGYCKHHWAKFRYSGELEKLPPQEPKFCSISGCNEKHSAKGFCQKHYREYKVNKNPMVYKNIENIRTARARLHKKEIVKMMGGGCVLCGYNKNIAALDFHHLDPSQKDYSPRGLMRKKSIDEIMNEIRKCILVCKNCHAEIHHPMESGNAEPREEVAP